MNTAKQEQLWERLARPTPKGHRFFRYLGDDEHHGEVSVADNSGGTPDTTDDGPLWIDLNREIVVKDWNGLIFVSLPVHTHHDDEKSFCSITPADLLWLLDNNLVLRSKIVVHHELHDVAMLFAQIGLASIGRPDINQHD